jgi:predicted permease
MVVPGMRIIAAAARLVPPARREDWRREWMAEAAHAWRRGGARGSGSSALRMRLRLRILTCWIDALWERKQTMTMSGLLNDVRFATRSLMRYPAFTLVAVLTLALGIGATTAVFTLVDGVLLRPLPLGEPERLLALKHQGREGADQLPMSQGLYLLYRERASTLEGIGLYASTMVNLVGEGEPERIPGQVVTPGLFDVLRVRPAIGRGFTEDEGRPDGAQVVVISDGLWRANFGADPGVLGRTLDVNGVTREIVGVMPPDFGHPDREARLWLPFVIDPLQAPLPAFGAEGVARMAPASTTAGVHAQLQALIDRLPELFPDQAGATAFLASVGLEARVIPLKEAVVGDVSQALWILLGTVGFVLLIACANVANLLLVRAEGRQRELALRVAVGAGRADVLRAFMAESIVLATLGGVLGVMVASLAVRVTAGLIPTEIPRMAEVGVDPRVLGFSAVVALGCALLFGFFPLARYGTDDLAGQLREGARGASGGHHGNRLRTGLVVVQVALALVLLVGSGLMLRSFVALRAVDPGFDPEGGLTARLSVPQAEVPGWQETEDLYRQLRERLAAEAGVEAVGIGLPVPLSAGSLSFGSIEVEDHPRGPDELSVFASQPFVGPGYFEALGIDVREGRTFRDGDGAAGARAVVVSESFARHWWPGSSPLGRRVGGDGSPEGWYEIVGVVGETHFVGLDRDPEEVVYFPLTLGPRDDPFVIRTVDVIVRTSGDPLAFVPALRRALRELNPRLPLASPRTLDDVVDQATARTSFTMAMLGAASGIALLLGLVGIYGVISYIVAQRTREIGVRMALGATAPSVRGMVVRQSFAVAALGVAVGLVAARSLSGVMASLLYGVSATDPVTYAAVAAALVAVAVAASWIPARRAARVDPSLALRSD